MFSDDKDYLKSLPASYWTDLVANTFSGPRVKVTTRPSEDMSDRLNEEEAERLQRQQEALGKTFNIGLGYC